MTITSAQLSVTWAGNGVTQTFSYPFLIPMPGQCTLVKITGGTATAIAPGLFSVSNIGNSNGGTVTYPLSGSPVAAGTSLILTRVVPYQQAFHPPPQGPIYNPSLESALDALAMQIMQTASGLGKFVINGSTVTGATFSGALTVSVANGVATVNVQTTPGPTGPQGPIGDTGPTGPTGATGTRGSIWVDGSGAPGTITGTIAGDQYLDTVTGNVYQLGSGGTWTKTADIAGPQGPQGVQGNTGAGSNIIVESAGVAFPNPASTINVTGAGAAVTESGGTVTINIPSGAVQLVSSQTVSAAASVGFLLEAGYDYFITGNNIQCSASGVQLTAVFGTGSGPTWDATVGHYYWGYVAPLNATAIASSGTTTGDSKMILGPSTSTGQWNLQLNIRGGPENAYTHSIDGFFTPSFSNFQGFHTQSEAITALKLAWISGTISGNFYLYSVAR